MVPRNGSYSGHNDELDITQNTEVLRGEHFKIAVQGMFLVAGIQNTNFKVGQYTVILLIVLNTDYYDLSPLTQLSFSNTTAIPNVYHYLDYDFSIAYTNSFNTESRLT